MAHVPAHETSQARRVERFRHHQAMNGRLYGSLRPVICGCVRVQHATSRSRGRNTLTAASVTADSSCSPERQIDTTSNGITIEVSAILFDIWLGTFLALWCREPPSFLLKLLLQIFQLLIFRDSFLLFLLLNLQLLLACLHLLEMHCDTSRCVAYQ